MKAKINTRRSSRSLMILLAAGAVFIAGTARGDNPQTLDQVMKNRPTTGSRVIPAPEPAADEVESAAASLANTWGVEVASIRLTAHSHMIDYRYRVLDAAKANDLFKRQIKPQLIHQESGLALAVPDTAKVGPLRNSNIPQDGKIYWMFFGNAGDLVKHGDKVTVVIGDFRVEDLVVE